jgi:hypothetical protein
VKGAAIPGYKLTKQGQIVKDDGAAVAKLPVNKRIARTKSTRIRVVKPKG